MSALKQGRYVFLLAMIILFLYSVGNSLRKLSEKQIGESRGTKRAAEMFFPSLVLVPIYDINYALPKAKGTMNLEEYYENRETIADKILMMQQSYESENG